MAIPVLETWQTVQRRLLWCYETDLPDGQVYDRPFENSGAWFVRRGKAIIHTDSGNYEVNEGHWMVPPSARVRRQHFVAGTRLMSIRFTFNWPDGRPVLDPLKPVLVADTEFPVLRTEAEILVKTCNALWHPFAKDRTKHGVTIESFIGVESRFSRFLELWCALLRERQVEPSLPQSLDPRVATAMEVLDRTDHPLQSVARQVSLSVSQLDRLFARTLRCSPLAYRTQRKMERVRTALRLGNESIKAIAYREGFRRLSHFSAWFARQMKMSPTDYRRRANRVEE